MHVVYREYSGTEQNVIDTSSYHPVFNLQPANASIFWQQYGLCIPSTFTSVPRFKSNNQSCNVASGGDQSAQPREHEGTESDTPNVHMSIATKVIYRLALKRTYVFRDVRIKANLDLMWLVRK